MCIRDRYSVFGEYQKELLEEYGIFAVEGSYETGNFSEKQLIDRMHYYGAVSYTHLDVYKRQVYTLTEFTGETEEIPDPYGQPLTAYGECYEKITLLIEKLAEILNSFTKGGQ